MKLVIAEKPSVAQSLARVIGANKRKDGYQRKSEDPCNLCRHPSPWDAMGMKHICSKSSLHTGFEL